MELNLDIPEVRGFKEDVLMLVVRDSTYGERVPVAIGTLHIDMILDKATRKEFGKYGKEMATRKPREENYYETKCTTNRGHPV